MHVLALFVQIALTVPPAARVLAVSVVVYGLLQAAKKIPGVQLSGYWAISFNVLLSALGVVVVQPADQLYTMSTLYLVAQAIGAAAGIHGTVKALGNQDQQPAQSVNMKALALVVALVLATSTLSGCKQVNASTPATAPDPYHVAAVVMQDLSTDLLQAQATETDLYLGGAIDQTTHKQINGVFLKVGQAGPQIDALIKAGASPATITEKVNATLAMLATISLTKVDPRTAAQMNATISAIQLLFSKVVVTFAQPTTTGGNTWTPLLSPLSPSSYRLA